jgi:hypothetical protein
MAWEEAVAVAAEEAEEANSVDTRVFRTDRFDIRMDRFDIHMDNFDR